MLDVTRRWSFGLRHSVVGFFNADAHKIDPSNGTINARSICPLGVQTWFHLAARFDSKEIRIARGRLAERLEDYDLSKHDEITEEVLDVFEDIGTVYKFGLINEENKKPSLDLIGTVFCSLKLLDFTEHRVHKQ